jgi:hypothetical protein
MPTTLWWGSDMFRKTGFARISMTLLVLGALDFVEAQPVGVSFGGGIESSCNLLFQGENVRRECRIGQREPVGESMPVDRRIVAYASTLVATAQDARCGTLDGMHGVVSDKGILAMCDNCLDCDVKKLPARAVARWRLLHELYGSIACAFDAPRIASQKLSFEDSLWQLGYEPILREIRLKPTPTRQDSAYVAAVESKMASRREDTRNACRSVLPMFRLVAKADSLLKAQGAEF